MRKLLMILVLHFVLVGGCAHKPTPEEIAAQQAQRRQEQLANDLRIVQLFTPLYVQAGQLAKRSEACGGWEAAYVRYKLAGDMDSAHWQRSDDRRAIVPELGVSRFDALMAAFDRGATGNDQVFAKTPCSIVSSETLTLLTHGIDVAALYMSLQR